MKTQLRGNCQVCGREHAANHGSVAQHGYTVKNGWFEGACTGWQYAPMQHDRKVTDKICADIRRECLELLQKADDIKAGKIHPATISWRRVVIAWEVASQYQQQNALNLAEYQARSRAKAGQSFADSLQALADKYHGQALTVVKAAPAPEPIKVGDVKVSPRGVRMVVVKVEGRSVYYRNERGFLDRVSPKKWRTFSDYVDPADDWEPVSPEEQERIIAAECAAIRAGKPIRDLA